MIGICSELITEREPLTILGRQDQDQTAEDNSLAQETLLHLSIALSRACCRIIQNP